MPVDGNDHNNLRAPPTTAPPRPTTTTSASPDTAAAPSSTAPSTTAPAGITVDDHVGWILGLLNGERTTRAEYRDRLDENFRDVVDFMSQGRLRARSPGAGLARHPRRRRGVRDRGDLNDPEAPVDEITAVLLAEGAFELLADF